MASNGTLASPSSQSDKLQDPPPVALDSSSAPLGVELPILRGCDTDIVAPPCTEAQASQIISASHLPTVEANVTSGSTTSNQFVPSLGSWEKPLIFVPPTTPPVPSTPTEFDKALVGNQLASLWPTLNDGIVNKQDKNKHPNRSLQVPLEKLPLPELKADGSLRFPWAARLGPQSRNLFRATSPTYRLDGTPESAVPSPSPSTQKVVTEQESLPATNLACEVPKICNQFSALDVLPVSSESEETITEKAATNSGLGLAQDQETPFVAPNVSTESPGNNVAAHSSILSTRIQQGIQTTPPSLITSTPTLADFQSAQAATPSMESSPSTKIINNEDQNTYVVDPSTTTSDVNVFESPSRFSALGDVDGAENESLSSLGLTRGGRETRPPIKFLDLEWKTVQGRGKHGRRGRGSKH
ncbi:hypothetical protein HID58_049029 [Brassica napus]|uniref:Uncharacterized protein n=1 Tax=Brassica napus TaxID=3708 RepID=A0ABQ8B3T5_BRANA|nr:hypothetical protein HID58_049029 [Brassica napus]